EAVGRLLDYYLHAAMTAGRHFTPWTAAQGRQLQGRPPAQPPGLSTLGQAAAWLEAERVNLHAAADYAAGRACFPHSFAIPVAIGGFRAAGGHWDQSSTLVQSALAAARQAGDRLGEADALAELGAWQFETGDYPAATAGLAQALELYEAAGDMPGQAHTLNQLGFHRLVTGDYRAAAACHQRALALARSASNCLVEAQAL